MEASLKFVNWVDLSFLDSNLRSADNDTKHGKILEEK